MRRSLALRLEFGCVGGWGGPCLEARTAEAHQAGRALARLDAPLRLQPCEELVRDAEAGIGERDAGDRAEDTRDPDAEHESFPGALPPGSRGEHLWSHDLLHASLGDASARSGEGRTRSHNRYRFGLPAEGRRLTVRDPGKGGQVRL